MDTDTIKTMSMMDLPCALVAATFSVIKDGYNSLRSLRTFHSCIIETIL